jgi:hypothetical protein
MLLENCKYERCKDTGEINLKSHHNKHLMISRSHDKYESDGRNSVRYAQKSARSHNSNDGKSAFT